MTMVLMVSCDRCGEPIDSGRTLLWVETGPLRSRRDTIDLCLTCVDALAVSLRSVQGADSPNRQCTLLEHSHGSSPDRTDR
jgi:hypothetical protein